MPKYAKARSTRRYTPYKKTYSKKNATNKRIATIAKSVVKRSTESIEYFKGIGGPLINTVWFYNNLFENIQYGDGMGQRHGDKIWCSNINIKGYIQPTTDGTRNTGTHVRMLLIQSKDMVGNALGGAWFNWTTATARNPVISGTNINGHLDKKELTVLKSKYIYIPPLNSNATDRSAGIITQPLKYVSMNYNMKKNFSYEQGGTNGKNWNIYLLITVNNNENTGTEGDIETSFNMKMTYKDI
uniref:Capsid protein n=1 Tax=Lorikeet CRESS-DNA-virus sp. TaxID=2815042 RepID=A0A8A4XBR0_9VIRU|nr:MAG: hypothetical protein [Lorikeet CRESS-DNA-virus sp.]